MTSPAADIASPPSGKHFPPLQAPLFDPEQGEVVLEPEAPGSGYWVGAPSVLWDQEARCWWLTYRRRRPRGANPDGRGDRGYVGRVARSEDGLRFEDVWEVTQAAWQCASMERFSLAKAGSGAYRLYVSYVDPEDSRWRIDALEAERPDRFDAQHRHPTFTAESVRAVTGEEVEGVKDPYVFRAGGEWHMLISYAAAHPRSEAEREQMHATADIYNTGLTTAPTALATSSDGLRWTWQGRVLDVGPQDAWDSYQARLNSATRLGPLWLGFYDGCASVQENYEERCGLVASLDLRHWGRLTPDRPAVVAPHASGSVRYVEVVPHGDALWLYYEYVRPDAAHELRRLSLPYTGLLPSP